MISESPQTVTFGTFLKTLRERVPPESPMLGPWTRLPARCGRRVTQEEVAEIVGVTRNWYRRLEADEGERASMRLLDRLASALTLTSEERFRLFLLCHPELVDGRTPLTLVPRRNVP